GRVDGLVRVALGQWEKPSASFNFVGAALHGYGLDVTHSAVEGLFAWPELKAQAAEIQFRDGPTLSATASADLAVKRLMEGQWCLAGDGLTNWHPQLHCESLRAKGVLAGGFTNLTHSGELTLTKTKAGAGKHFDIRAAWEGTNLQLTNTSLELANPTSRLALRGDIQTSATVSEVQLTLNNATFE